jgi:ankyrin repeat/SOCS box protein 13/metal transporter CNNM
VKVLMYVTFIVSYPIAKLLDCLFNHEENRRFNDEELYNLVGLHADEEEEDQPELLTINSKSKK